MTCGRKDSVTIATRNGGEVGLRSVRSVAVGDILAAPNAGGWLPSTLGSGSEPRSGLGGTAPEGQAWVRGAHGDPAGADGWPPSGPAMTKIAFCDE
ncbi:hypothetical protein GCM10026982_13670 [Nocardiopsis aegyptia]